MFKLLCVIFNFITYYCLAGHFGTWFLLVCLFLIVFCSRVFIFKLSFLNFFNVLLISFLVLTLLIFYFIFLDFFKKK